MDSAKANDKFESLLSVYRPNYSNGSISSFSLLQDLVKNRHHVGQHAAHGGSLLPAKGYFINQSNTANIAIHFDSYGTSATHGPIKFDFSYGFQIKVVEHSLDDNGYGDEVVVAGGK
jgi:hypothetical protein